MTLLADHTPGTAHSVTTTVVHDSPDRFESVCHADTVTIRTVYGTHVPQRQEFSSPTCPMPAILRSNSDVAMALHQSGEPLTRALANDPAHLARLVVLGIERAGLSALLDASDRAKEFNRKDMAKTLTATDRRTRVWSDRHETLCTDLAFWLCFHARGGNTAVNA